MSAQWSVSRKLKWIKKVIAEHESGLLRYAFSLLRDLEAARDVVQESFLRLWQQQPQEIQHYPNQWLFTVCRNLCMDKLRRQQTELKKHGEMGRVSMSTVSNAEGMLLEKADQGMIGELLCELSDQQREVLRLKFQEDMSYKQISELTGMSVNNVGVTIHNAIKKLRELMPHSLQGGDND